MRRTLMILSLLFISIFWVSCTGSPPTTVTNANTSANMSNTGTGTTAGTGPQNQGIGGNTNNGVVNGDTYTVPPGFNKNGDTGSATRNSNTP